MIFRRRKIERVREREQTWAESFKGCKGFEDTGVMPDSRALA